MSCIQAFKSLIDIARQSILALSQERECRRRSLYSGLRIRTSVVSQWLGQLSVVRIACFE
jgi:hypothetical protein